MSRVGSAVEMITYEKTECRLSTSIAWAALPTPVRVVNVFENDTLHVDFKPLFECIHIYTALDSLDELQKSYQADRKASIFQRY